MKCKIIQSNKAIALLLTFFSLTITYSQEAEILYQKEYSKLSFVFQPSILKKSEAANSDGSRYPSMEFTNDFSYQFGVYYNFAQYRNFNFKTGLIAKEFIPKFDLNISDSDIGNGEENFLTQFDPFSQFILSVPLKAEYFLKLNNKLNLSFGAGINLNIVTGTNAETSVGVSVGNSTGYFKDVFSLTSEKQNNVNFSSEFSLGLNYKTRFALIDLSFYINNMLHSNYTSGHYQIYNLNQSPDKTGNYEIKNNFYGISLSVSPKKGWLKSNN